jgi:hypothetical protein
MLEAVAAAEAAAHGPEPGVAVRAAQTLVGRACNLSQVLPELSAHMHGGYRVVGGAAKAAARGARLQRDMPLRRGSETHRGWLDSLSTTSNNIWYTRF